MSQLQPSIPELVGEVEKAIAAAAQAGQTMILVSHDMSFVFPGGRQGLVPRQGENY